MAPNNRISRGNTSDLVGLWNKIATTETEATSGPTRSRSRSPISGNLTANNQIKFRKTSAYEPSPSSLSPNSVLRTESVRKTSALVLLPTYHRNALAIDTTDAITGGEAGYRPRKTSALSTSSTSLAIGYPLKSALKQSTGNIHFEATVTSEPSNSIPMVVTSPPAESRQAGCLGSGEAVVKRGTNLGRSKSVKYNCVKFDLQSEGAPASPHFLLRHGGGGGGRTTTSGGDEKPSSPFDKFKNLDQQQMASTTTSSSITPGRLTRQASLPSVSHPCSAPPPVDQQQQQQQQTSPTQKRSIMSRSPSSAKELLLMWAQQRTNSYPGMNVTNFSASWSDGLAFCALIHYYYPEAFDFEKLDPKNRKENFELAFKVAEDYAGICPLLDVEDMVMMAKPDWKCVFTYVQSFYRRFRNGRDPPPPTRTLTLQPEDSQVRSDNMSTTSTKYAVDDTPLSAEKKKSLLSKYMIDDEDEQAQKERRQKFRAGKGRPLSLSFSPGSLQVKTSTASTTTNKPFDRHMALGTPIPRSPSLPPIYPSSNKTSAVAVDISTASTRKLSCVDEGSAEMDSAPNSAAADKSSNQISNLEKSSSFLVTSTSPACESSSAVANEVS